MTEDIYYLTHRLNEYFDQVILLEEQGEATLRLCNYTDGARMCISWAVPTEFDVADVEYEIEIILEAIDEYKENQIQNLH